jgi:hypothetical protein
MELKIERTSMCISTLTSRRQNFSNEYAATQIGAKPLCKAGPVLKD